MDVSPKAGHLEREDAQEKRDKEESQKRDYYLIKATEAGIYTKAEEKKWENSLLWGELVVALAQSQQGKWQISTDKSYILIKQ